jgi:pimeloyl-ACP methyl ester carboxylesterase
MATVWRMKDRAGTVGAQGVGPLLCDALEATKGAQTSFHLVGHSYGAKVMLSALAHPTALQRPVSSLLLLQPAVSNRCFAADADGNGHPGGYHGVFERVRLPIVTTFSQHDFPLRQTFHLAVRRKSDIGEQRIAAGEPSPFAALGGYGPSDSGGIGAAARVLPIRDVGSPYEELDERDLELIALDGSRTIDGHGDISNPSTWWALYEQARRSQR